MIPVKHNVTEIDNLPGEEVEFTISAGAAHLIMESLASLYENSTLAVIREYSTNARDSHVTANRADIPIDVTLPSDIHPFFTVRDTGLGMSAQELKEVYTSFGDSTKRDSNLTNGLLGYGSKSALAYTNTFTITAAKNGKKTVGVVTRKEVGPMVLKEILNVATAEPNGVTVTMPVHNIETFNKIARDFYGYWPTGQVNINGEAVVNSYIKQDNFLHKDMYARPGGKDSYIVMGNVPYPIRNPASLYPTEKAYVPFVSYVPMGAVEFTPSREALKYTQHTTDTLQRIVDDYLAEVQANAEKEINGAGAPWAALRASRKWRAILKKTYKYKGKELPAEIEFEGLCWNVGRHWNPVDTLSKRNGNASIDLDQDVLVIVNGTKTAGTYHRSRLKQWKATPHYPASLNGKLPPLVYFTQDPAWASKWVNPECVVSWEDIKAQTPPPARAATAGNRIKGSFDILKPDGTIEYGRPISTAKFWVEHSFVKKQTRVSLAKIFDTFHITDEVVIVPANREIKFIRDFTKTPNLRNFLKSGIDLDGDAMYTGDVRTFHSMDSWTRDGLKRWDASKIDDPQIKELIRISNLNPDKPGAYDPNLAKANLLDLPFKRFQPDKVDTDKIERQYPLMYGGFSNARNVNQDHTYLYLNAAYAARKAGSLV